MKTGVYLEAEACFKFIKTTFDSIYMKDLWSDKNSNYKKIYIKL